MAHVVNLRRLVICSFQEWMNFEDPGHMLWVNLAKMISECCRVVDTSTDHTSASQKGRHVLIMQYLMDVSVMYCLKKSPNNWIGSTVIEGVTQQGEVTGPWYEDLHC